MRADLHLHTIASDGALPPATMVALSREAGMDVIAITDHDTIGGLHEALQAQDANLRVLPGVELSVGTESEVHLLGYGVCPDDPATRAFFDEQMRLRRERMLQMLAKLRNVGVVVAPEEASSRGGFMGRMNLAEALRNRGYASGVREAFAKYLTPGTPGYVPRRRMTVCEGIGALRALGTVPVVAHPARSGIDPLRLEALLPSWMDAGLEGVEAWHASHVPGDALRFERIARRNGLLVTGGSDCHGRTSRAQGESADSRAREHACIGESYGLWRDVREDVEALLARMAQHRAAV